MSISQHNQGRLEKTVESYFKISLCTSFQAKKAHIPGLWRTRCLCPVLYIAIYSTSYVCSVFLGCSVLATLANLKSWVPLVSSLPAASCPSQVLVFVSIQWDLSRNWVDHKLSLWKNAAGQLQKVLAHRGKHTQGKRAGSQQSQFEISFKSCSTTT